MDRNKQDVVEGRGVRQQVEDTPPVLGDQIPSGRYLGQTKTTWSTEFACGLRLCIFYCRNSNLNSFFYRRLPYTLITNIVLIKEPKNMAEP